MTPSTRVLGITSLTIFICWFLGTQLAVAQTAGSSKDLKQQCQRGYEYEVDPTGAGSPNPYQIRVTKKPPQRPWGMPESEWQAQLPEGIVRAKSPDGARTITLRCNKTVQDALASHLSQRTARAPVQFDGASLQAEPTLPSAYTNVSTFGVTQGQTIGGTFSLYDQTPMSYSQDNDIVPGFGYFSNETVVESEAREAQDAAQSAVGTFQENVVPNYMDAAGNMTALPLEYEKNPSFYGQAGGSFPEQSLFSADNSGRSLTNPSDVSDVTNGADSGYGWFKDKTIQMDSDTFSNAPAQTSLPDVDIPLATGFMATLEKGIVTSMQLESRMGFFGIGSYAYAVLHPSKVISGVQPYARDLGNDAARVIADGLNLYKNVTSYFFGK